MTEKNITICGHGSGFPSVKNMYDYLSNRYKQTADNGKHKGIVAVRRIKGMTDEERQAFHDAYKKLLGRNYYSQTLREYVSTPHNGRYYSDCSSSGDDCYRKAGHDVGWLNTAGIYNSSKFESVPVIIKEGHITNPEVLKVADALLFVGNDPDRPLQIGHVEFVYEIKQSGWHWLKSSGVWYYQDENGMNSYGWKDIKETGGTKIHRYYFNSKGQMLDGCQWIDGKLYTFMPDGGLEGALCRSDGNGVQSIMDV